ncbi:hypothetical protein NW133_07210 [Staphylococcus pettenkoferi]|uniref:Uncharacterized protein n=1 Tax=Staphylococcus pettenkoferi TaxID=170573 RepID=A0ABT4BNH9_9STAP|nr:hypothetical protein [Staphylococcus pettenkoferi]MCY1583315.1 hypothetical protein [Staphylococcus pettenkoferi]
MDNGVLSIRKLLVSLKVSYKDAQDTEYQENQKLFIEMGWAIRRLLENNQITYFDNFNDTHIKQLIFDEMKFDV